MPRLPARQKHAFSLVELSIVLVILGLLVGGVLSGQSLIRAAELRAVLSEYNKYLAAHNSFRDKYFSIPGDMTNATQFWGIRTGSGSVTGADAACYNTINVLTGTCNGNGDGLLSDNGASSATCPEQILYWQHLANAGLIEGKYQGSTFTAGQCYEGNTNVPVSKVGSAFIWIARYEWGPRSADADYFDGPYLLDAIRTENQSGDFLFNPQEAWNLDTKIDDGKPATGIVYVLKHSSSKMPNCATTDVVSTATYDLSRSDRVCTPRFKMP